MRGLGHVLAGAAGALALVGVSARTAYAYTATLTSLEPPGGLANDPDMTLTAGGLVVECDSATGSAALAAPPSSGTPSGSVTYLSFANCTGTLMSTPMPMVVTATSSWGITPTSGGAGTLTNVSVSVIDAFGYCALDIDGSTSTSYALPSQTLAVTGPSTLTVSNTVNCFGEVVDGDPVTMFATFAVS